MSYGLDFFKRTQWIFSLSLMSFLSLPTSGYGMEKYGMGYDNSGSNRQKSHEWPTSAYGMAPDKYGIAYDNSGNKRQKSHEWLKALKFQGNPELKAIAVNQTHRYTILPHGHQKWGQGDFSHNLSLTKTTMDTHKKRTFGEAFPPLQKFSSSHSLLPQYIPEEQKRIGLQQSGDELITLRKNHEAHITSLIRDFKKQKTEEKRFNSDISAEYSNHIAHLQGEICHLHEFYQDKLNKLTDCYQSLCQYNEELALRIQQLLGENETLRQNLSQKDDGASNRAIYKLDEFKQTNFGVRLGNYKK